MPFEVFLLLAKELGPGSATCLGLTCRKLYDYLKGYHPNPIDLTYNVECLYQMEFSDDGWGDTKKKWRCWANKWSANCNFFLNHKNHALGYNLQKWVGRKYWFVGSGTGYPGLSRVVLKSVYGVKPGMGTCSQSDNFDALVGRYEDWYRISWRESPHNHRSVIGQKPLKSPHNLGGDWYDMALEYIENDLRHTNKLSDSISFWQGFNIYKRKREDMDKIVDDIFVGVIADGIQLLGL
ncbi:uncharacterized protein LY89DRAFT_733199 [Mollisia scopiformis]|uniref:F-box domain-containing protein n=1 Tax=Mollisia scopiformis TaxID=149040 RepID=A0A194XAZ6_MOLSC|nr:uncharacterized protein LY89DRAFT_733199 [Mollisia scopiformis]KUJ17345.1 hypothetical protein LY89DRAFT_733199 [Mollisia scopiformis]